MLWYENILCLPVIVIYVIVATTLSQLTIIMALFQNQNKLQQQHSVCNQLQLHNWMEPRRAVTVWIAHSIVLCG